MDDVTILSLLVDVQLALGKRQLNVKRSPALPRFPEGGWIAECEGHFAISTSLGGAILTLVRGIQAKHDGAAEYAVDAN